MMQRSSLGRRYMWMVEWSAYRDQKATTNVVMRPRGAEPLSGLLALLHSMNSSNQSLKWGPDRWLQRDVSYWHKADIASMRAEVRYQVFSRRRFGCGENKNGPHRLHSDRDV